MINENIHYLNRFKYTLILLLNLTIFSIAFGYIEASIVHYLRLLYYPEGFSSELKIINSQTILIEMGREFATLVIVFTITLFTRPPFYRKFVNFVFIFALWDISYYVVLYLFEKWPSSLLSWDILFLLPITWFAPIIAPITVSLIGILGALIVHTTYVVKGELKFNWLVILLIIFSLILWLISFLYYTSKDQFPQNYNWILFFVGIISAIIAFFYLIKINWFKK